MTEPRHGDPLDYPDIPGESGLSEEYRDSLRSPEMREAIAKRKAALAAISKRDTGPARPAGECPRTKSPSSRRRP